MKAAHTCTASCGNPRRRGPDARVSRESGLRRRPWQAARLLSPLLYQPSLPDLSCREDGLRLRKGRIVGSELVYPLLTDVEQFRDLSDPDEVVHSPKGT